MPFVPVCNDIRAPKELTPGLEEVMLWCQQDDAVPFVPLRFLNRPATALIFKSPMQRYTEYLQGKGIKASCHVCNWRHDSKPGAVHCIELPLIFGNYQTWKDAPLLKGVTQSEYDQKSREMKQSIIEKCCN